MALTFGLSVSIVSTLPPLLDDVTDRLPFTVDVIVCVPPAPATSPFTAITRDINVDSKRHGTRTVSRPAHMQRYNERHRATMVDLEFCEAVLQTGSS